MARLLLESKACIAVGKEESASRGDPQASSNKKPEEKKRIEGASDHLVDRKKCNKKFAY